MGNSDSTGASTQARAGCPLSTRTHQREEDQRNGASPVRNQRMPSSDAVLELRDSA
jgi:hypothetical protein